MCQNEFIANYVTALNVFTYFAFQLMTAIALLIIFHLIAFKMKEEILLCRGVLPAVLK